MSKYNKVTYCKSCGASNDWSLSKKTSLLEKPKFCNSCGSNLITGRIAKKRTEEVKNIKEEDDDVAIPDNIPPLELDMDASYFPKMDSQSFGNLVSPAFKENEEELTDGS